jgi:hypothetical protein
MGNDFNTMKMLRALRFRVVKNISGKTIIPLSKWPHGRWFLIQIMDGIAMVQTAFKQSGVSRGMLDQLGVTPVAQPRSYALRQTPTPIERCRYKQSCVVRLAFSREFHVHRFIEYVFPQKGLDSVFGFGRLRHERNSCVG